MGRKTFESIGKILPNRKNIIFSQNPDFKINNGQVEIVHSMLQIQEYNKYNQRQQRYEDRLDQFRNNFTKIDKCIFQCRSFDMG